MVVREGEQALIFNRSGRGRLAIGPRRVSSLLSRPGHGVRSTVTISVLHM